ncbi:MAG: single-stranded DNA-binding protein [Prevotellaceae bacterium]|jgi:single-strand DNA-binding protein|nr:single-stranded DNA-binding protein [Prevotellaceae bacterium]
MALNKVFLIGNVGRDPEVHYFDSNTRKASFTLATTDRGYTKADGTVVPDKTEWHNIVLWRGLAEVAEKYIRKGSKIFIEGKITSRSYEDKTGIKRYVTEVVVDNLELLDKKGTISDEPKESNNYSGSVSTNDYSADAPVIEPDGNNDLPF